MKKVIAIVMVILALLLFCSSNVFATNEILDSETTSQLIELSETQKKN